MAFCRQCGSHVNESDKFCPSCGAETNGAPAGNAAPGQAGQSPAGQYVPPAYGQTPPPSEGQVPPPPPSQGAPFGQTPGQVNTPIGAVNFSFNQPEVGYADPRDVADNKVMAILSYLGVLFLVPLLSGTHKTSPYTKFHLNQGIVLLIADVAYCIAVAVLVGIIMAILVAAHLWVLIGILNPLLRLLYVVPLVLVILGIVNAAGGKLKQLPFIGGIKILK